MSVEAEIVVLTQSVQALTNAVNVKKAALDTAVDLAQNTSPELQAVAAVADDVEALAPIAPAISTTAANITAIQGAAGHAQTATDKAQAAEDAAAEAVGLVGAAATALQPTTGVFRIATFADASSVDIPAPVIRVLIEDRKGVFRRAGSEPSHAAKFINDSGWWELDEDSPTPQMFGAAGDYDPVTEAGTDDSAAFQLWVDYCIAVGAHGVAPDRKYKLVTGLIIRNPLTPIEPWQNATGGRMPKFDINGTLYYRGMDALVRVRDKVSPTPIYIKSIVGPGMTFDPGNPDAALPAKDGGQERVGIFLERGSDSSYVRVDSISDFNFGVLGDGCFSCVVDIGNQHACYKGVYMRPNTESGFSPGGCTVRFNVLGGIFVGVSTPLYASRRPRSCHIGLHWEAGPSHLGGTGNTIIGGAIGYCVLRTTSTNMKIETDQNFIVAWLEGAQQDGYQLDVSGSDNHFWLSELASPDLAKNNIRDVGFGNTYHRIANRVGSAVRTSGFSGGSAGTVDIANSNNISGNYRERFDRRRSSGFNNNLIFTTGWGTGGGLTAVTGVVDAPVEMAGLGLPCTDLTTTGTSGGKYTSANANIGAAADREFVKVVAWAKPTVNSAEVVVQIRNGANDAYLGGYSTRLRNGIWKKITFLVPVSQVTFIKWVWAIRNVNAEENGCTVRVLPAFATLNYLEPDNAYAPTLPADAGPVIEGRLLPHGSYAMEQNISAVRTVTSLTGNVLNCNNQGVVNITANPGALAINTLQNVRDGAIVEVHNNSGGDIVIGAQIWASFTLADKAAFTFRRIGGSFYRVS